MKTIGLGCALVFAGITLNPGPSVGAQELQQKLAAVKEGVAANQQALRSYSWIEKTELSLKGEVKNTKVEECHYGPDGKVQKTPMVEPPPPAPKQRGLKGRIIEKKTGEMKEELEAAAALVQRYVPPDPDKIQVVMNAGGAVVSTPSPATVVAKFAGYEKQGDSLTLTLDAAAKTLRQMAVSTWLDKPDEPVSLTVTMQSVPGGPNYPGSILLSIPSSKIEVRITKSNYQKVAR